MTTTTMTTAVTTPRWYWAQNGRRGGPVSWPELQALAAKGKLRSDDWVLQEGTQEWQRAGSARTVAVPPGGELMQPPPPPPAAALAVKAAATVDTDGSIEPDDPSRPQSNRRGMTRMLWGTGLFVGGVMGIVLTYDPEKMFFGGRYMPFRIAIILGIIQFLRGISEAGSDD